LEVIRGAVMMRRSGSDANAVPGVWRNEEGNLMSLAERNEKRKRVRNSDSEFFESFVLFS
jgi:hypothetical protein